MKKILSLLTLCAVSCFAAEVNLIPDPVKLRNWSNPPSARISAAGGIITILPNLQTKNANTCQRAYVKLSAEAAAIRGKKFELSFKYRTEKLNGALQVTLRQTYGKTGSFHGVSLKKWHLSKEWKEVKVAFSARKDAKELYLYVIGRYMKEGDKVELKDLKVTPR